MAGFGQRLAGCMTAARVFWSVLLKQLSEVIFCCDLLGFIFDNSLGNSLFLEMI